jgi:hypothetical protein
MGVTNCYVDWPETGRSRIVLEAKVHNRLALEGEEEEDEEENDY